MPTTYPVPRGRYLLTVLIAVAALAAALLLVPSAHATGGLAFSSAASTASSKAGSSKTVKKSAHSASTVALPRALRLIAVCESGGDPTAISKSGRYRGKYQFSRDTWASMGGSGDPARASEAEQDRRALKLYRAEGTAPWPACSADL